MSNQQFVAQVAGLMRLNREQLTTFQRRMNMSILRRLVLRSPVDTGRFRANWQIGIDSIPGGEIGSPEPSKRSPEERLNTAPASHSVDGGVVSRGLSAMPPTSLPIGHVCYIVNNLPYGERLEYGWSKQAPSGMVRLTLAEHRAIIDDAWRNRGVVNGRSAR